ncbi:hypothetical protein GQ55_2G110200 [Panicum hallii var. hallii]|uniref:Uncharacterized protein n=1 Tax=Panicum hallii var. hallii TaxID=1504633 RepID=A0A2T7ENQ4_9POAL|nr:hypothetical protein GQ55_2G110200 [Panicum hallii var. hallii]
MVIGYSARRHHQQPDLTRKLCAHPHWVSLWTYRNDCSLLFCKLLPPSKISCLPNLSKADSMRYALYVFDEMHRCGPAYS